MGLLGGQPAVDAVETVLTDPVPDEQLDDDDEQGSAGPSKVALLREHLFREHADAVDANARQRKLRAERGDPEFANSEAYEGAARLLTDDVPTEIPADRKKKAVDTFLGDTIENIQKGPAVPEGAHSSSSKGRTGESAAALKLKKMRGRPRFEDEEDVKSVVVSARVTPTEKEALKSQKVTAGKVVAVHARALDAGATPKEIEAAIAALSVKKRD